MGLLLLKTSLTKRTTLSIKVMKLKKRPKKAVIQPLKVVLVEKGSTVITHIYRSRENFRLDEKARYDKAIARIIKRPEQHYGH